ncbi:hypothetical protein K7711_33600 [Nocardia sp. CA2R105]|uniref:hypothetical protein n=1 Tax=Nocardia coffeae TaxID=2873381 RepID=UPI001CA6C1DC|nr:hypothetical protein [Nocardia coffeae]MBY8861452.1 hypothetical protein [Nocardia coffeae]
MTRTHPIAPDPPARSLVSCERVQLRAVIDDVTRWQSRVERVLACGRRRWLGRTELDACPALRRWNRITPPHWPTGHPTLRSAVAAAAAGVRTPGTGPTDFATAIMLLSGCPALITGSLRTRAADRPPMLTISLFALPADDLVLAQDLVGVTIDTAGGVTYRSTTTLALPRSAIDDRPRRDAREIPLVREPEVLEPLWVPASLDGIGQ